MPPTAVTPGAHAPFPPPLGTGQTYRRCGIMRNAASYGDSYVYNKLYRCMCDFVACIY